MDRLKQEDLFIDYILYKLKNGYSNETSVKEFNDFLSFFVQKTWLTNLNEKEFKLSKEYSSYIDFKNDKYKINYSLSKYHACTTYSYFMNKNEKESVSEIIKEYLNIFPKKKFNHNVKCTNEEVFIGKCVGIKIITFIWNDYVEKQMKWGKWPSQCKDIEKYLFDMDLASIIELNSIKKELLELYNLLSKKVAAMYHYDKKLKISSDDLSVLACNNYQILAENNKKYFNSTFGLACNNSLYINLEKMLIKRTYKNDLRICKYNDLDTSTEIDSVNSQKALKLIKKID